LDGEMVMLDGRIYQMTADGQVHIVDEHTLTPFACVTS
jgi:acetolactate decarboxylase